MVRERKAGGRQEERLESRLAWLPDGWCRERKYLAVEAWNSTKHVYDIWASERRRQSKKWRKRKKKMKNVRKRENTTHVSIKKEAELNSMRILQYSGGLRRTIPEEEEAAAKAWRIRGENYSWKAAAEVLEAALWRLYWKLKWWLEALKAAKWQSENWMAVNPSRSRTMAWRKWWLWIT